MSKPSDKPGRLMASSAANELIKQHGADAPIHASMRADELLDAGDMDGQAVWKRILGAVELLLSEERPEGVKVH